MIEWWRRRRYRQKVYSLYSFIMRPVSQRGADLAFRIAFKDRKKALEAGFATNDDPIGVALTISAVALGRSIDGIAREQRDLALLAIRAGNKANPLANNIIDILDMAKLVSRGNHDYAEKALMFEAVGALQGKTPEERERDRFSQLMDDIMVDRGSASPTPQP